MSTCKQAMAARRRGRKDKRFSKRKSMDVASAKAERRTKLLQKRAEAGSIYTS